MSKLRSKISNKPFRIFLVQFNITPRLFEGKSKMRNLRCYVVLPVFLFFVLILNSYLMAQIKIFDRKYDPVIISANALSGFESSDFAGVAIG